ncbi:7620_t:CDS:2, partial [Racocetra persica]
ENQKIDEIIKETQMNSKTAIDFVEWIPYEQFEKIEKICQGGFRTIYSAFWIQGPLSMLANEFKQTGKIQVALKSGISPEHLEEETWLTDTIHQFLESAVHDIPGLSVHSTCATLLRHLRNEENRKPDRTTIRTIRLKLEDNQFKILYVEVANPELKGRKCQEDAEKLQQLIKLNLDELLRNFQHIYRNKDIAKKIYDNPLITIQFT